MELQCLLMTIRTALLFMVGLFTHSLTPLLQFHFITLTLLLHHSYNVIMAYAVVGSGSEDDTNDAHGRNPLQTHRRRQSLRLKNKNLIPGALNENRMKAYRKPAVNTGTMSRMFFYVSICCERMV